MDTHDMPVICTLGESDFELRGWPGQYAIWSESAQKGVDFKSLSGDALEVAQGLLRIHCAKYPFEADKLSAHRKALDELVGAME